MCTTVQEMNRLGHVDPGRAVVSWAAAEGEGGFCWGQIEEQDTEDRDLNQLK